MLPALDPNDPSQACLMAGGDCINKVAGEAAKAIQKEASKYNMIVQSIINDAAKATGLHPHFLWFAFFRPKQWPPMSSAEKARLRLGQQVYEAGGGQRPSSLSPFSGNPGWDIPESDADIRKAFKLMLKGVKDRIHRPLIRAWAGIVKKSVRDIQEKCEEIFGQTCDFGEAEDLLYGDLGRMVAYKRIPGAHPNLIPLLLGL